MSIDANISPVNTWWPHYPLLAQYIARCCFMLRQGDPFSDIAVYSPLANQWTLNVLNARKWTREFNWGELGNLLVSNGYDFDLINDDVLQNRAQIIDGQIKVDALEYKILILPNVQSLPLQTMQFMENYVQQGGVVIALERIPDSSVGLADYGRQDLEVKHIVDRMFQEPRGRNDNAAKAYGKGHTYYLKLVINRQEVLDWRSSALDPFVNTLRHHLAPDFGIDFALQGLRVNNGLTFLHRKIDDADLYFVTNIQDQSSTIPVTFRVVDKIPWKWNPYNGEISHIGHYRKNPDGLEIPLQLQPYESMFVLWLPGHEQHVVQSNFAEITAVGPDEIEGLATANGLYTVLVDGQNKPRTSTLSVTDALAPMQISGNWRLVMQSPRFSSLDTSITRLFSWTTVERTRHFSGTGRYDIDFELPKEYLRKDLQLLLDLGRVGNIAEISLNGAKSGTIWMRGQTCPISGMVHSGKNHLTILVTNTLINRVSGMQEPPAVPAELVPHYGSGTAAALDKGLIGFKPLPASGLLGPVKIIAYKKVRMALK